MINKATVEVFVDESRTYSKIKPVLFQQAHSLQSPMIQMIQTIQALSSLLQLYVGHQSLLALILSILQF